MKSIQKEGPGGGTPRGPSKYTNNCCKDFSTEEIIVSIAIQIHLPLPCCGHCGSSMNRIGIRVSGEFGPYYVQRWVCSNRNGEGNCPSYDLNGKQVIDIGEAA